MGQARDAVMLSTDRMVAEGLVVVNAFALGEVANNPVSLVAGEGPIGMKLVPEDPLPHHDVGSRGARNELPGIIVEKAWYSSIIAARQLASARALR
jgi:hypothetical protein